MIQSIVVGVDGTDSSTHALEWAAERAAELHAEVVAVFAVPPVAQFVMSVPPLPADAVKGLRGSFEHRWCQPLRDAGVAYRNYVVPEDPAHALVDIAEQEHADLIVVGAQGSGGVASRLLGSVSQWVSHHAPCPVVVVPTSVRPDPRGS